jgi:hypothetical protein
MPAFFVSTWRPDLDEATLARPFEPDAYAAALSERWPSVRIVYLPPDRTSFYQFELPSNDGSGILGNLTRDKTTVVFTYYHIEQALDFIIWHRSYVPGGIPLFFFDEGLDVVEELHPDTSRAEIEAWINRALGLN